MDETLEAKEHKGLILFDFFDFAVNPSTRYSNKLRELTRIIGLRVKL
ncbi:MAG: hypothetical protein LBK66_09695 [Spirochaetaceae bacterium]|nr:hypothetical protein [Spirochaetaceae bacterium]